MKTLVRAALVAISVLLPVASASARERPLETYYATLSAWDRIDGMGHRLTSVADILRQDRANYHNRHLRDPSDIGDRYFRKEANRRQIPALLAAGRMDADTTRRILEQRPRVRVDRYADRLEVTIEFNAG
jgi:hypothetical protein